MARPETSKEFDKSVEKFFKSRHFSHILAKDYDKFTDAYLWVLTYDSTPVNLNILFPTVVDAIVTDSSSETQKRVMAFRDELIYQYELINTDNILPHRNALNIDPVAFYIIDKKATFFVRFNKKDKINKLLQLLKSYEKFDALEMLGFHNEKEHSYILSTINFTELANYIERKAARKK